MFVLEMAENNCVVCFKNVRIYSVGECDHPVCFECSARMRVLCCQNECPMCRHEMEMVVFTERVRPFKRLNKAYPLYDKKYNIAFENGYIRDVFESLLQYVCQTCQRAPIFDTFEWLKDHMKRIHDLYCCDLCADNLKIFPGELRYYTRQELSRHKKTGDVDNRSHRGHPLCEFCRVRYLDRDELYKHLRKEHFYCHICDGEGIQQFYGTYTLLRDHYREKHYLCEEGTCIDESMTSVFPTEIDLKAHKALVHYKNSRNKQAVRQARTLDLEFALPPRNNDRRARHGHDDMDDFSGGQQSDHLRGNEIDVMAALEQDFPTLGNSSSYHAPRAKPSRDSNKKFAFNDQNFPALGSDASTKSNDDVRPSTSGSVASKNISMQVDRKKPKDMKTRKAQHRENAPSSSTLSSTWVEKAKEKPQIERIPASTAQSDTLVEPPRMDGKNFPNLKKNAPSTSCSDVSSKTAKKSKKSPTASSALRVNYSEAIVKNTTVKDEKVDIKTKSAPRTSSKSKEPKEERSLNLNRDNKTHSFLLNANRKKVKMKPEVLIPLNDPNGSHYSLPSRMAQLKLSNNSDGAQEVNAATTVIDKKVNNAKEKIKDAKKEKTKNVDNTPLKLTANSGVVQEVASAVIDKKVNNTKERSKDVRKENMKNIDPTIKDETKDTSTKEKRDKLAPRKHANVEFGASCVEVDQRAKSIKDENLKNGTAAEIERLKNESSPSVEDQAESSLKQNKYPPGLKKPIAPLPPPGFDQLSKTSTSSLLNSGMTSEVPFVYQQPNEFVARNSQLIEKVCNSLVLRNEDALNEFKNMSLMFREGLISASDYYIYCSVNIEIDKFEDVFVDLIALLPDIFKQQELWAIHQAATPSGVRNSSPPVDYCTICYQILKLDDAIMHYSKHGITNDALLLYSSSLAKY